MEIDLCQKFKKKVTLWCLSKIWVKGIQFHWPSSCLAHRGMQESFWRVVMGVPWLSSIPILSVPYQLQAELYKKKEIFFLAVPHGLWDLISLTRDWTFTPCIGPVLTTGPPGRSLSKLIILLSTPYLDEKRDYHYGYYSQQTVFAVLTCWTWGSILVLNLPSLKPLIWLVGSSPG